MKGLFETAAQAGVQTLRAEYVPADRNGMVSDFYSRPGFTVSEEHDDGTVIYSCDVPDYESHPTFIEVSVVRSSQPGI
ncbi:hypothetical protein [Aurantiacibacter hainanensis]|uniref:hypothetical protein n=1 Tax=Aurantiacibacter hainanensis TaxID=3076114 RepID=UPI0030C748DB